MPGRIIQGLKQAGTQAPGLLPPPMVDKLGISHKGDPPPARWLEVLAPGPERLVQDQLPERPFEH